MAYADTRRHKYQTHTVASTATDGATGDSPAAAQHDDVLALINVTTLTAGSVVFKLQVSSDDGTTWFDHPDATALSGTVSAIGVVLLLARAPIGSRIRVHYDITTGPMACTVVLDFSKRGQVI